MGRVVIATRRGDLGGEVRSCIGVHKATMIVVLEQVMTTMEPMRGSPGAGVEGGMARD